MLLREFEDPIAGWEHAERYLGIGTRTYSPFSSDLEISECYHPLTGKRTFPLQTFWVPYEEGTFLSNGFESALQGLYHDGERFLLPVHPEAVEHPELHGREQLLRCLPGPPIEVVPSANARTVFVKRIDGLTAQPHFLKLHYPRRLSRFTRRLRRPIIALQLWVADELARIGVVFLPEVGGGVFGQDPRESWGFLIREVRLTGARQRPHTVPLFALYGRDYHAEQEPTLLEQLMTASGEPPAHYLAQRIVQPLVRLWLDAAHRTGCALEPHGQNALFNFSAVTGEGSIAYRDCAVYVDPAIRRKLGLGPDLPEMNVISRDLPFTREQVFSLTYDSFMGHHALAYIARFAQQRWGIDPKALQSAARNQFAALSEGLSLLPDTVFYYDSALHSDGQWRLVDTGQPPEWR